MKGLYEALHQDDMRYELCFSLQQRQTPFLRPFREEVQQEKKSRETTKTEKMGSQELNKIRTRPNETEMA